MNGAFTERILIIISSGISIYIVFNFLERMFDRVYNNKWKYFIAFIISWLLFTIVNIRSFGIPTPVVGLVIILITGIYLYGVRKSPDILILFMAYLFLIMTEIIGQLILVGIFKENIDQVPVNIFQDLITFLSFQIAMRIIAKKTKPSYQDKKWYLIILVPLSSIITMLIIFYLSNDISAGEGIFWRTWACILIFITNLYVFFLFTKISKLNHENEEFLMIKQQAQMQYRYYNDIEEKYNTSRQLFHDINNHLAVLEDLYSHNEEAFAYASELRKEMDLINMEFQTNSRVLNILLNHKIALAHNKNIRFELSCEDIDFSFISEIDLSTLFSNLLDNAFEECIENNLRSNFIELRICHINNFVVIHISNSTESGPVKDRKGYVSQKEGHMGIGLTNIKKISEKYGGVLGINYKDNIFTVQITFSGIEQSLLNIK